MTVVTNTAVIPNAISKFVYDGDGSRVLQVQISGTQVITTAYAGALEVQISGTQRITKTYYSAGSQLIAMRQFTSPTTSVLYFLHSDHLGSTSLTTDASGNPLTRQLYDAWGNVRSGGVGLMPTDIGYTGQRLDNSTGLMYFRARYYAHVLGRFLSADTIVPSPSDPQQFNRYSYGLNNPVKYLDPSGHMLTECAEGCSLPNVNFEPDLFIHTENYGYFDQNHFYTGSQEKIIHDVENAVKGGGGPVVIGNGAEHGLYYEASYYVSGDVTNITGVALGIYEDWSTKWEAWEGTIPWPKAQMSSFSMEDLPSHYLGFVRAARGFKGMEDLFAAYAKDIGPYTLSADGPPQYNPVVVPQSCWQCRPWGGTFEMTRNMIRAARNHQFTPIVPDANGGFRNVPWPSSLTITPVGSGPNTWQYVSESHNLNLGTFIRVGWELGWELLFGHK